MDTVNIPSETVPAEMKACEQTLKRAKELVKAEPVVAYWCKLVGRSRGRGQNLMMC
jgi:vacuolar protein sorting-associated protein VTA1